MASLTVQAFVERHGRTFEFYIGSRLVGTHDITEYVAIEEEDVPRLIALIDEMEQRATGFTPESEAQPC